MPSKLQKLGQHMLVDRKVLAKIIAEADVARDETVCEAGTGLGILTAELCKNAGKVVSYEVDRKLFEKARDELRQGNLELVNCDLFKTMNLDFDVFVSNLPYSRSRDAVEWLAAQKFNRAILTVQLEFAEKLDAGPGDKNYRAISALAGHCFKIRHLFRVNRRSFSPPPRVESVVLKILPARTVGKQTIRNLNFILSKRNKKASSVAAKAGVSGFEAGEMRIDELAPSRLVELAEML